MFLDEPTSGLDSAASLEVMSFVRRMAKRLNVSNCFVETSKNIVAKASLQLIIIASIHQPSTTTFELFDKLLLMSNGKSHYFGPVTDVEVHFKSLGLPMPLHMNPAEFLLDLMNTDFTNSEVNVVERLDTIEQGWTASQRPAEISTMIKRAVENAETLSMPKQSRRIFPLIVIILVHRAFIKSYRDVVAYGIRILMYSGLAIMMGKYKYPN